VSSEAVIARELNVPLTGLPSGLDGLRLAHVSDLHFRRWDRASEAAQTLLTDLDYDLLLVTGDFCSFRWKWRQTAELTGRFLGRIAQRPAYAVLGNHDDPRLADADLPLRFLRNESLSLDFLGAGLTLAGVDQSGRRTEDLDAALRGVPAGGATILLAHYPSTVFRVPIGKVQLVLSGHTHGGQIRLPGLGCVWANDRIPRRMSRGLHEVAGTMIHVSPGIGVSLPLRIRVDCPAEVTVLTLVAAASDHEAVGSAPTEKEDQLVSGSVV
jgi:predicted MPP superfamily phosphohydrolase